MAATHDYYLSLNKPTLLFFPFEEPIPAERSGEEFSEGQVVMVTIKGALQNNVASEVTAFYMAQYEITVGCRAHPLASFKSQPQKAIENIVFAHILTPFPDKVVINGVGYTLEGVRKPWKFGQSLDLTWGGSPVMSAKEKWLFRFRLV